MPSARDRIGALAARRLLAAAIAAIAGIEAGSCFAYEMASATRQAISLDGEWQVAPLPKAEAALPPPADGWTKQRVPSFLRVPDSPEPQKAKVRAAWLKRSFPVPADWKGRHVRLEFEAVSRWSKVYLNGKPLGEHLDLFSPFSFDVSAVAQYGQTNELAVWVTMEQTLETCSNIAGMPDLRAGIWQSVRLAAYPMVRADDVFVMTSFRNKEITARVTLANAAANPQEVRLSCEVRKWVRGGDDRTLGAPPVLSLAGPPVALAAGETKTVDLKAKWESPELWTPDAPNLYVLTTTLRAGDALDVRHDRFGFREFWIDGTSFVLNGVKVFLPLLWADWWTVPTGDLNDPKTWGPYSDFRQGFLIAKASNIRALRFPHFSSGRTMANALDAADETGMMLLCANTFFNFWSTYREKPEFWAHSEPMVRAVIRRDRNHPSAILWSMSNEWVQGANGWPFQVEMLRKMELIAKEEDPTRPTLQSGSGALNGKSEIISLHYPHESFYNGAFTELPQTAYWLETAKEVHSAYLQYVEPVGQKPIALTESLHVFYPGGPSALYFWMGEDVYPLRARGEGWGKITEAVEAISAMNIAGLRASGAAAVAATGGLHLRHGEVDQTWARAFAPVVANPREVDSRFFAGDRVTRTFDVHNDLIAGPCEVAFRWRGFAWRDNQFVPVDSSTNAEHYRIPQHGEIKMTLAGGERRKLSFDFIAPAAADQRKHFDFHHGPMLWSIQVQIAVNGVIRFVENHDCTVYAKEFPVVPMDAPVALLDPTGDEKSATSQALQKLQVKHSVVKALAALKYPDTAILVIARNALGALAPGREGEAPAEPSSGTRSGSAGASPSQRLSGSFALPPGEIQPKLAEFTAAGGWVVCLEQDEFPSSWLTVNVQRDPMDSSQRATMVQPIDPSHPVLQGFKAEDFRFWRGDHYVTRLNLIKPVEGNFRPILGYGNGATPCADRTPLLEVFNGRGGFLLSQLLLVEKFDSEPVASRLLASLLTYARRRQIDVGARLVRAPEAPGQPLGQPQGLPLQKAEPFSPELALLLPGGEAGKRDWIEGLGAKADIVMAKNLPNYKVAAIVLAKGFPDAGTAQALHLWVSEGGKLLVLGLTPDLAAEGAAFCRATARSMTPRQWTRDMVFKPQPDPLTTGISNADLCWENKKLVPDRFLKLEGILVSDLTTDPLLQKVEMGKGVMLVCQIPLAAEKDFEPARRVTSILLTNLGLALSPKLYASAGLKETYFPVDIRRACNMGFKDDVAGDQKGGWTDQGENDLRSFPVGEQKLLGVPFRIVDPAKNDGKSCIVLRGKERPYFPRESGVIEVGNPKWDKIYFLHAAAYAPAAGQRIATYVVKYFDLSLVEVPVSIGREVRDWWDAPTNLPNGRAAWTGENRVKGPGGVTVYLTEWRNPYPGRAIASIQMISTEEGIPALLAITGAQVTGQPQPASQPKARNTINIDNGDLKANPDGTFSFHDGYRPAQEYPADSGQEAAGGPVHAGLWRRLFDSENLLVCWSHGGGIAYATIAGWARPEAHRRCSFTMKYSLPPGKVIERGTVHCKIDYWGAGDHGGRGAGSAASIQVSRDGQDWREVYKFVGGRENFSNAAEDPPGSGRYAAAKYGLPAETKGWETLYIKCSLDQTAVQSESAWCDLQMLRTGRGKEEVCFVDLALRNEDQ